MLGLQQIIHSDQKGFMPGRKIATNIRRLFDLMCYCDQEKIEAFVLSLDFMKCFDRVDFSAIYGSLQFFGFADYIINWTRILYSSFQAGVLNNGYFINRISINRSVHQGGNASAMLFLVCAETLAIGLREDTKIKGIPVDEIIHLLSQYADDADIFSLNDQESLNAIMVTLEKYHYQVGFTISYDKTTVLRIGSLKKLGCKAFQTKSVELDQ